MVRSLWDSLHENKIVSSSYQIENNILYKSPTFLKIFSLPKWEISGFFNRPGVK